MSESECYLAAGINRVMKFNFLRENMYSPKKNDLPMILKPSNLRKCSNKLLDD